MAANKKIKNATTMTYKGINFKSKLELMAFKVLEEEGFNPSYEPYTYELVEGFKPTVPFYIKNKNTGMLELNAKKIISIKYTPDIYFYYADKGIFIELKGFENDTYYLKKKLFRFYLENREGNFIFAEVKTKRELLQFIKILKTLKNEES